MRETKSGIAHLVYKNPDILILDEATNALNSETEEQIFSNTRICK